MVFLPAYKDCLKPMGELSLNYQIIYHVIGYCTLPSFSLLIEYLSSEDASLAYGALIVVGCYVMAQVS